MAEQESYEDIRRRSRRGRNDPCWCGSGRKYKKCHIAEDNTILEGFEAPRRQAREHVEVADPGLRARVFEVYKLLDDKGVQKIPEDLREQHAEEFEMACYGRWLRLADNDTPLVTARDKLLLADRRRFRKDGLEGFKERRGAFYDELQTLRAAGDRAVPHLAQLIPEDSWASILAIEELVEYSPSEKRNRALVEALFFVDSDWLQDTSARAAAAGKLIPNWQTFEDVVRFAAAENAELQDAFWASLFEVMPQSQNETTTYMPDLGRALRLMYELGHHDALRWGLESRLSGFFDRDAGVRSFLDSSAMITFVEFLRSARPVEAIHEHSQGRVVAP